MDTLKTYSWRGELVSLRREKTTLFRCVAGLLVAGQVLLCVPAGALEPAANESPAQGSFTPPPPPEVKVNHTLPAAVVLDRSDRQSDGALFRWRVLEEPLVPLGAPMRPGENRALVAALDRYRERQDPDDVS